MATRKSKRRASATRAPARKVRAPSATRRWSQRITRTSDAMDLEQGVFTLGSAAAIARSLKRSVERSTRRKAAPFQSAMSMLNFEINRAGRGLPPSRKRILEAAKDELRRLFNKPLSVARRARGTAKDKKPARRTRSVTAGLPKSRRVRRTG